MQLLIEAFKAYGAATPLAKAIMHAAAFFTAALALLILPDVLAAFGVTVATWKNYTFFVFSSIFFGIGLGLFLASFTQNLRQPQEEKHESPNQEGAKETQ